MTKKTNKKVTKKLYPLGEMAAEQLRKELAPILAACDALSKKYAALAASAENNIKKIDRSLAKSTHGLDTQLSKQRTAWDDAAGCFGELADDLQFSKTRTPYLSIPEAIEFRFLDTLAGLEDLTAAAETMRKVSDAISGKPTGGAALSGAKRTTKTARN